MSENKPAPVAPPQTPGANMYQKRGERILAQLGPHYVHNATENYQQIKEGLKSGRITPLEDLPKIIHKPAIIFGSGVHGREILRLKKLIKDKNITVFSSPSNTNYLIAHDITPTYVVSVDQQVDVAEQISTIHPSVKDIPIITTMVSHPKVISDWPGPVVIFKPHQQNFNFIEKILPQMYSRRTENNKYVDLFQIGVLNMGCVTNTMFSLASYLGHDPLFLCGNDLCFSEDRYSLDRYHWREKAGGKKLNTAPIPESAWEIEEQTVIRSPEGIIYEDGIATSMEMSHYRLAFYILWNMNPMRIYTFSPETLLSAVPFLSTEELLDHYEAYTGPIGYPFTSEVLRKRVQEQLRKLGVGGPVEQEKGTTPSECSNGGENKLEKNGNENSPRDSSEENGKRKHSGKEKGPEAEGSTRNSSGEEKKEH